jgi:UDP-N-acetylglucosamine 2-epimerase
MLRQIRKSNGNALRLRVGDLDDIDLAIRQNNITMLSPVSYSDYLCLLSNAKLVLMD